MTVLEFTICLYFAVAVIATVIDLITICNMGYKCNPLISVSAFKIAQPDFNSFGIFFCLIALSIVSPLFGVIRLFYNLFTWHPKGKNNNGN